jgi:hypothetical protein
MIVVLYTLDLEPITAVDMPMWLQESIERYGIGRIKVKHRDPEKPVEILVIYLKRLTDEKNRTYQFFVTAQESLALSMMPQQLPGQLNLHQQFVNLLTRQNNIINKLK